MLDGVSLDQLKAFVAAVDEGSFSGAARKLLRAQSVVSEMVANLEGQIGVKLFDRSGRYPKLTAGGAVLLADARGIISGVDFMKARARGMSSGVEPELSAVVDVLFPIEAITAAAKAFQVEFPATPLRLYVEALGGVLQPILDGRASLGVAGPGPGIPNRFVSERIADVEMLMVAAPDHPLALHPRPIPKAEAARYVQLVLTDRSELSAGREFGVISRTTWRLADLFAKHAFLRKGLGWGGMPRHAVQADLDNGALVELDIEDAPPGALILPMFAVYPAAAPPGPAGRWLIERLKLCPRRDPALAPADPAI